MTRPHWFDTTIRVVYDDDAEAADDIGIEPDVHLCKGAIDLDDISMWHDDPEIQGCLYLHLKSGGFTRIMAMPEEFKRALMRAQHHFESN